MPLEKRASPKPHHVSVTFRVPAEAHAASVDVVGEFTDWGLVSMRANPDGSHDAAFDLEVGTSYRFRYLVDGRSWENDWAADNYVPNGYGGDDSVVDVRLPIRFLDGLPNEDVPTAVSPFADKRRPRPEAPAVESTARHRGPRASNF